MMETIEMMEAFWQWSIAKIEKDGEGGQWQA
jgi:hypothetical protein